MYNGNTQAFAHPGLYPAHANSTVPVRNGQAAFDRRVNSQANTISSSQNTSKEKPPVSSGVGKFIFIASACLLAFALMLLGLAHVIGDGISRAGHSSSTKKLEIVIANDAISIPANLIRFPSQRRSGIHSRVDLYMTWPELSGYSEDLKSEFNKPSKSANLVFVTLEPRSMSQDMSGRIGPIYSKFFEGFPVDAGYGLMKQPLSAKSGYIDEDLYYEAASPYPFATRCTQNASNFGTLYCIRDIHIGKDMMLTYRFRKEHLKDWLKLDSSIRELVAAMMPSL